MNSLQKYQGPQFIDSIHDLQAVAPSEPSLEQGLIKPILRRWRIVLTAFVAMCAVGIPVICWVVEPYYEASGAIRVAPILTNILSGESDYGGISNYQSFMNTQADLLTSTHIINRVADDLADKNLEFFAAPSPEAVDRLKRLANGQTAKPDPAAVLRRAIASEIISAKPGRQTELLKITMKTKKPDEGKMIVDAFIRAYMAMEVSSSVEGQDRTLLVLENQQKVLVEKLQRQRANIRELGEEYGTTTLEGRHDMMLDRVASLLNELTRAEAHRIYLEAQVQLLKSGNGASMLDEDIIVLQQRYINEDPMVRVLTENIAQMEQVLMASQQTMAPTNPALERKAAILEAFKTRLEERKAELSKSFEEMMEKQIADKSKQKLAATEAELAESTAYENRLREVLTKEDSETVDLGRKQLAIQDIKDQLALTKDMYDTVSRRIGELEMERKRPARVSVAYNADVTGVFDKTLKYIAAFILAAFAMSAFLGLVRDRLDASIHTPDDVIRRVGARVIGTTSRVDRLPQAARQAAEDYQTICANLGLLNGGNIPHKLVVTSSGMQDGKTTLAINLAASLAKSGMRVLLIDGDLRKPDILRVLKLSKDSCTVQKALAGDCSDIAPQHSEIPGLEVLAAESHVKTDIIQLLSRPRISALMEQVGKQYDHVIIDTPPVLAFPDALLWATAADGVILTSYAGQTGDEDLKETISRLQRVGTNVIGSILHNVRSNYSYNRYSSYYYNKQRNGGNGHSKRKPALLLSVESKKTTAHTMEVPK
jgi:capsular exopolysaccharide synthesis family protein